MNIELIFHFSSYTYKPLHDFSSVRMIKGRLGSYPVPVMFNPLNNYSSDYLIALKLL